MFLLTEGTLFFLDLALNARTCAEKPSLSSVVQKWVDEVAAATESEDSVHGAHTTTGGSSTLFGLPPVYPSTAVGQASPTSGGCFTSEKMPHNSSIFSKTLFPADENAEENETSHFSEPSAMSTSGVVVATSCTGIDDCHADPDASLSQREQDALKSVKRKVDDADIIFDVAGMSSISVESPPRKKAKYEDASTLLFSAPPEPTRGCAAFITQLQALCRPRVSSEGYNTTELVKNFSEYTIKDLPVPCDQRWSQSFLPTAILWYSTQKNLWNVPNVDLTSALQRIFNVVYPDIIHRITPMDPVFALTLQRIHAWRNSFGSSAVAMVLHFFSSLDDKDDIHAAAEFLATDFRFLRADPDSSEPTEPFRSPFLLMLLAITHLGDIAAFVDVPGWHTRAMAAGEGGEGVIAIASAALERALTLFCDGTLDVDHILSETARQPDSPLPKTLLDTLAPHALRFSSANWGNHTAAYREAVDKRGSAFVRETFAAAQAKRRKIAGAKYGESEVGDGMSVSGVPDPRALL